MDDGADRMFFGRCLNGLCDDWESVESVCAGLGIGAGDAAGARAVGDCLRRAVEEGLAEAFDFREGAGFVRHDGGLEETAGLWFAITERGRAVLEGMPEAWFADGEGVDGTDGADMLAAGKRQKLNLLDKKPFLSGWRHFFAMFSLIFGLGLVFFSAWTDDVLHNENWVPVLVVWGFVAAFGALAEVVYCRDFKVRRPGRRFVVWAIGGVAVFLVAHWIP